MALRTGRARSLPSRSLRATAVPSSVPTVLRDYVFAQGPTPTLIPYAWLAPPVRFRAEAMVNVATIGQGNGATAVSVNTTSRDTYGVRAVTGTLDTACDADPTNLGAWLTTYRGDPRMRMPALMLVDLIARTPEECVAILRVHEGDRIVITDTGDPVTVFVDLFDRQATSSWGTFSGGTYNLQGGTAGDYSVDGSRGLIAPSSVGSRRFATVDLGEADFDLQVELAIGSTPASGTLSQAITARFADINNYLLARVQVSPSSTVTLLIDERAGGVTTTLVSLVTSLSHVDGVYRTLRFRGVGPLVRAKVWDTGTPEPAWALSTDATTPSVATLAGPYGINNTAVTTHVFSYDNFLARDIHFAGGTETWPAGSTSLVVEGVSHAGQGAERKVSWVTSAVAGAVAGVPGPWFRWGSSRYGGADVIPF